MVRFPAGARDFIIFQDVQIASGAHPFSHSRVIGGLLRWGYSVRGVELTANFHLAPRLRSSGAVPPLPIHACIDITLTFIVTLC